jgi:hypothetical protein
MNRLIRSSSNMLFSAVVSNIFCASYFITGLILYWLNCSTPLNYIPHSIAVCILLMLVEIAESNKDEMTSIWNLFLILTRSLGSILFTVSLVLLNELKQTGDYAMCGYLILSIITLASTAYHQLSINHFESYCHINDILRSLGFKESPINYPDRFIYEKGERTVIVKVFSNSSILVSEIFKGSLQREYSYPSSFGRLLTLFPKFKLIYMRS